VIFFSHGLLIYNQPPLAPNMTYFPQQKDKKLIHL